MQTSEKLTCTDVDLIMQTYEKLTCTDADFRKVNMY